MAKRLLVDGNTCAFLTDLDEKQDILTAGDNIDLTDNTVSVKIDVPGQVDVEIGEGATDSFNVGFAALASSLLQDSPLTKITVNVPATSGIKTGPFYAFLFQTEDSDTSNPTGDPAPSSWGSSIARSKNGVNITPNVASTAVFEFDPITLDTSKKLIIAFVMQTTFSGNQLQGFPCRYITDTTDNYSGTYYYPLNDHKFWPTHVINTTLTYDSVVSKSLVEALNDKQDKLIAGDNIAIEGNVISAAGGGERIYNKYVVVGVYGQSNAVGYDESPLTKYDIPVDTNRVKQYSDSLKSLTFCAENLQNMNTVSPRGGTASAMATERENDAYSVEGRTAYTMTKGIHLPLANLICSVIPDDYGVIIVPGAYGGQAIASFVSGTSNYNSFKDRLNSALALNADNVFGGIVWCQGESDAAATPAATYKQKFESIINDLHNDINTDAKKMPRVTNPKEYWFAYEWPIDYKNRDAQGILPVQKEVLGDTNYVAIPDETPANSTNYCASNPGDHYGKDSFRKVIAPRVFAKMQEAGMFQNVEYSEADSKEIEELEVKVNDHKGFINMLIDKINELAQQHPGEVDPIVIAHDVTKSCALSQYGSGATQPLTTTANSITMTNGGGWRATLFDESITHFECNISSLVSNVSSIAFIVAENPNEPGSGCGFFLNAVQGNKLGYVSSSANGFNSDTPGASWAGHAVTAGDKLVMDISGDNVKVVLTNNGTDYTIFNGSVSGGLGTKTEFTKPRLGVFGAWSSGGTISLTNVVMTSAHI